MTPSTDNTPTNSKLLFFSCLHCPNLAEIKALHRKQRGLLLTFRLYNMFGYLWLWEGKAPQASLVSDFWDRHHDLGFILRINVHSIYSLPQKEEIFSLISEGWSYICSLSVCLSLSPHIPASSLLTPPFPFFGLFFFKKKRFVFSTCCFC